MEAFRHVLVLVREKMLMPHHLERWILVVDTYKEKDTAKIGQILTTIYNEIKSHFPETLDKILILNNDNLPDITNTSIRTKINSLMYKLMIFTKIKFFIFWGNLKEIWKRILTSQMWKRNTGVSSRTSKTIGNLHKINL